MTGERKRLSSSTARMSRSCSRRSSMTNGKLMCMWGMNLLLPQPLSQMDTHFLYSDSGYKSGSMSRDAGWQYWTTSTITTNLSEVRPHFTFIPQKTHARIRSCDHPQLPSPGLAAFRRGLECSTSAAPVQPKYISRSP